MLFLKFLVFPYYLVKKLFSRDKTEKEHRPFGMLGATTILFVVTFLMWQDGNREQAVGFVCIGYLATGVMSVWAYGQKFIPPPFNEWWKGTYEPPPDLFLFKSR